MSFQAFLASINGIVWGAQSPFVCWWARDLSHCAPQAYPSYPSAYGAGIIIQTGKGHGDLSSFAALCTALSATIGTGNIVGVATAIKMGGPGALF